MSKKVLGVIICILFIIFGIVVSFFIAEKLFKLVAIALGAIIGFILYKMLKKKAKKKSKKESN